MGAPLVVSWTAVYQWLVVAHALVTDHADDIPHSVNTKTQHLVPLLRDCICNLRHF